MDRDLELGRRKLTERVQQRGVVRQLTFARPAEIDLPSNPDEARLRLALRQAFVDGMTFIGAIDGANSSPDA